MSIANEIFALHNNNVPIYNENDWDHQYGNFLTRYSGPEFMLWGFDAITAFYIPEHVNWLNLYIRNTLLSRYVDKGSREKELQEILDESWQVPQIDPNGLFSSPQIYMHLHQEQFEINGEIFKRHVLVKPFLPYQLMTTVSVKTESFCDIYIEKYIAPPILRAKMWKDVVIAVETSEGLRYLTDNDIFDKKPNFILANNF